MLAERPSADKYRIWEDGAINNTLNVNEKELQAQEDLIIFQFFLLVGLSRS